MSKKDANNSRRGLIGLGVLAATLATVGTAQAEYPEQRIEVVVPWTAGGSTDARARIMAPELEKLLNTTVVVRNVAGAAGTIGTNEVAQAAPDGYTILMTPSGPTTIQPHLRTLPYSLENFDVVCRVDLVPMVFMTRKDGEYGTMEAFVEAAKADPGKLTYSTAGVGTLPHIVGLGIEQGFGITLKHLPAKGSADAMKNILGGIVDAAPETLDHVSRFDVTALAVASAERQAEYPDVPTLKEMGVDLELSNWQALYLPKGAPDAVRAKLADACVHVFDNAEIVAQYENMNSRIDLLAGPEANAFAKAESDANAALLTKAGLK